MVSAIGQPDEFQDLVGHFGGGLQMVALGTVAGAYHDVFAHAEFGQRTHDLVCAGHAHFGQVVGFAPGDILAEKEYFTRR